MARLMCSLCSSRFYGTWNIWRTCFTRLLNALCAFFGKRLMFIAQYLQNADNHILYGTWIILNRESARKLHEMQDAFVKSRLLDIIAVIKLSGSVQQQQSSQQRWVGKKKKTVDSVTAECELILWYVLWGNNVLFYLSRLIPDLTVRSTSYESSLKENKKQTQVIVTPFAATPGSKCCEIILIFHRHHWGKKTLLIDNNWKATRNHGKFFQDHKPIWHSWSFIWISSRACDGVDFPPPMGETGTGLVNSLKWIIATLVGEAPLFSHRLLLLVTSTGFRSCQRQRVMSVVLDLLRVNLKNSRHIVANIRVRVWDVEEDRELEEWEQRLIDAVRLRGACVEDVENSTFTRSLRQSSF